MDEAGKYGIADGVQALKVVRQHASEWGVAPNRIGMLGFSAGAMVTSSAVLQADPAARPNFAAMIYGGPFGVMPTIPSKLPPTFLAWAQDDNVALGSIVKFYDALKAAGHKPEVHIFASGGHGFGLKNKAPAATVGSIIFTSGWKRKDSRSERTAVRRPITKTLMCHTGAPTTHPV